MASRRPPVVFISHAWEDGDHAEWVKTLATHLSQGGCEVILDLWNVALGEYLPQFMEKSIRDCDYVLMICTPRYKDRVNNRAGGGGYEGHIFTADVLYGRSPKKYVPIWRSGETWSDAAPDWVRAKVYLDLTSGDLQAENLEPLFRHLHDDVTPPRRARIGQSFKKINLVFPPTNKLVQSRVFSDNYDSVRQADRYDSPGASSVHSIVGRLRFDMLLARTLVLTDAQVLDGRILQELALTEDWRRFAATWPSRAADRPMIEIRARRSVLGDAFVAFVAGPKGGNLKPFEFSSLDAGRRLAVARAMSERPADNVASPEDVFDEMGKAGATTEEVERIRISLAHWANLVQNGTVAIVEWEQTHSACWTRSFNMFGESWTKSLGTNWGKGGKGAACADLIARLKETRNRTAAYRMMRDVSARGPVGDDISRIRIWYDRAYNRAIAMQHRSASEWICDASDPIVFADEQAVSREALDAADGPLMERIRNQGRVVDVPSSFTEALAAMPADDFLSFTQSNRERLNEWWTTGDTHDLAKIVEKLVNRLHQHGATVPVDEWAESNRAAVFRTINDRGDRDGEAALAVHYVVDDKSENQRTASHRESTS